MFAMAVLLACLAVPRVTEQESLTVYETPRLAAQRVTKQWYARWFPENVAPIIGQRAYADSVVTHLQIRFVSEPPPLFADLAANRDSIDQLIAGATAVLASRKITADWNMLVLQFEWSESWSVNPLGYPLYIVAIADSILQNPLVSVQTVRQSLIHIYPPDPP